jgi:hypothetical protein
MTGIADLITAAKKNPLKPVITGLLNESETAGLHGPPEAFKTMLLLQLADCVANGECFLSWPIPRRRTVYFFETEMSVPALGDRLAKMYKNRPAPRNVHFATEPQLRTFRKAANLREKFHLLNEWVGETAAELLILDTCNPFFRGKESPNDETTTGAFFDLLDACPAKTNLFARHNHKRRMEDTDADGAAKIRGSGQFGDVPDLLIELRRADKRTDKAILDVTKFRHGTKPDQLTLWFDRGHFRLIAVPPVIHLLLTRPLSRGELLSQLERRFGIKQRSGDGMINEQRAFLRDGQIGHKRAFEIDWQEAKRSDWFRLVPLGEAVQDVQDCISPPVYLGEDQPSL